MRDGELVLLDEAVRCSERIIQHETTVTASGAFVAIRWSRCAAVNCWSLHVLFLATAFFCTGITATRNAVRAVRITSLSGLFSIRLRKVFHSSAAAGIA